MILAWLRVEVAPGHRAPSLCCDTEEGSRAAASQREQGRWPRRKGVRQPPVVVVSVAS